MPVPAFLALLLSAAPAAANLDCPARPLTAAERGMGERAFAALSKALPAALPGWTGPEDSDRSLPTELCQGMESTPLVWILDRTFSDASGMKKRTAALSARVNPWDETVPPSASPLKLKGAAQAYRLVEEVDDARLVTVWILLGSWRNRRAEDGLVNAAFRKETPHTAVQTISVRIDADPKDEAQILRALGLKALAALLSKK